MGKTKNIIASSSIYNILSKALNYPNQGKILKIFLIKDLKNRVEIVKETFYLISFNIRNSKNIDAASILKNITNEIYNIFKQKPIKYIGKSLIASAYLDGKFRILNLAFSFGSVYFLNKITLYCEKAKSNISEKISKASKDQKLVDPLNLRFEKPLINGEFINIKDMPLDKYKIATDAKRRRDILRKAFLLALLLGLTLEAALYLLKHLGYIDWDLVDGILDIFSTILYYFRLVYETIVDYIKGFIGLTELEDRLDNLKRGLESHTNMLASQDTRIKTLLARLENIKETINKDLIFKIKTETKRELQKDLNLSKNDILAEIIKEVEAAIASQSRELSGLFQKRFDNVQKELFESLSKKIMEELEIQKAFQELENKKASSTPLKENKKSNPLLESKKSKPLPAKINEKKISERLKQKKLENAKKLKNTNVTKE